MEKEELIEKVARDLCEGVNKQETRKDKKDKLEIDMLTTFGVLGEWTPLQLAESFYNSFGKNKKEILEKLEKLHLFFHNVGMDPTGKLTKKYSISYANCQLRTQNDFLIAEGVCKFAIDHLTGNLSDTEIPDVGKEIKKILVNQK